MLPFPRLDERYDRQTEPVGLRNCRMLSGAGRVSDEYKRRKPRCRSGADEVWL